MSQAETQALSSQLYLESKKVQVSTNQNHSEILPHTRKSIIKKTKMTSVGELHGEKRPFVYC